MSSVPLKRSKHAVFLECLKPYPHLESIPKKIFEPAKSKTMKRIEWT